jgi:hypothetical protein
MEVYLGFYLIIVWMLGWSHAIAILLFWQMMRVRYITSGECQAAWSRFDQTIDRNLLSKSWCPGLVTTAYSKVKALMASYAAPPAPPAANAGGEGGPSMMQRAKDACNIF